jgi:hypothetical protein
MQGVGLRYDREQMSFEARAFLLTLAASTGGAALSGAAAAVALMRHPPGSPGPYPALWVIVVLPVAAALACAGALTRTAKAVALNSLAFLLPQAAAAVGVFFLFAHPGGLNGEMLILTTAEFWLKLAGAYALVTALVGASSLAFRLARK